MKVLAKHTNLRRFSPVALAVYSFNMRNVMRADHPDLFHFSRMLRARGTFTNRLYLKSQKRPDGKLRGERKVRQFPGLFRVSGLARWQRYGKVYNVRKIHAI